MKPAVPANILPIRPFRDFLGASVEPPGSKSITNRALVLAALRAGTTRLSGALFSEDTRTMVECLRRLGFRVEADAERKTIEIEGRGGEIPQAEAELFVENAGTAARFLTAMLALKKAGTYRIDGVPAMRRRPMSGLLSSLEKLGCRFEFFGEKGCFPFVMHTPREGIRASDVAVDASASSQILSALLLIAPVAGTQNGTGTFSVYLKGETVSRPFVEMTAKMIACFGGGVASRGNAFVFGGGYAPCANGRFDYAIEPDATAASYFLILPFVHRKAEMRVRGLNPVGLQGDAAFAIELSTPPYALLSLAQGENFSLTRAGTVRRGFEINFNAISDTFLTLAAVAPLLEEGAPLTIRGIAHTRRQETDRVAAAATELAKIVGAENVSQSEDALTIRPISREALRSRVAQNGGKIRIATYRDHRIAMSFGVLGTLDLLGDGSAWLEIEDPACCGKTFPEFFSVLKNLRHSRAPRSE